MKTMKSVIAILLALVMTLSTVMVAFAADPTAETEQNGTAETANPFAWSDGATGSLSDATDVDFFKFTTTKPGRATLTFRNTASAQTIFDVAILDAAQNVKVSFRVDTINSDVKSPNFSVIAGDYYVKVSCGSAHSTNDYKITVAIQDFGENYETEPNNTMASASLIKGVALKSYSTVMYGIIENASDVDYWYFNMPAPGIFEVQVRNEDQSDDRFKVQISTVFNTGDTEKVFGEFIVSGNNFLQNRSAEMGVAKNGYYIKVSSHDGGVGAYSLRIWPEGKIDTEFEYNGLKDRANHYDFGKTIYGSNSMATDLDYFRVITTNENINTSVNFEVDSTDLSGRFLTSAYWKVELRGADDKVITTKDFSNTRSTSFVMNEYAAGTYYFVVKDGTTQSKYKISTSAAEPKQEDDSNLPFWERIAKLDWWKFWVDSGFNDLVNNLDWFPMIWDLIRTSLGTLMAFFITR